MTEKLEKENVNFLNFTTNIPICPKCKKPTKRKEGGSTSTLAYYPPIYDERGININPDRNITTTTWTCLNCSHEWITRR